MSFWRTFGFHTVSAVETILDRDSYTLEELMDEEEILQEVKSQNKKLMDFLTQPATLRKLFEYITQDPADDADPKHRFKYPFISCEILCSEIWVITEAIFGDNNSLLGMLFQFLDKDAPLNPLLASYTSRVAIVLLSRRTEEVLSFIKTQENIIPKFINHLASASIMELLLKIIGSEESPEGAGVIQWLCGTELVPSLLGKFDPMLDEEIHENAGQTLADIIATSAPIPNSPLLAQFESEGFITQLFKYILSGNNSVMLHGLSVVIELLRRHAKDNTDDRTPFEELSPLLSHSVSLLDQFNRFLKTSSPIMLTTVGQLNPLGFYRLKVIDFYLSLLRTRYRCIDERFSAQESLKICLELFFNYKWNNFLHATVEQIIHTILEGQNDDLKIALLCDAGLLDRIVEANKLNTEESNQPKNARLGYMGFLTAISLSISNSAAGNPRMEGIIEAHAEWKNWLHTLVEIRTIENKPLGGHRPLGMPGGESSGEEEEEQQDSDSIFARYKLGFTDDFPEESEEYDESEMTFDTSGTSFVNSYNNISDRNLELYDENHLEDVNSDDSDDDQDDSELHDRKIADVGGSPSEESGFPQQHDQEMRNENFGEFTGAESRE